MKKVFMLLCLSGALGLSGCQRLEYSNGQERFSRLAFGTRLSLSQLQVETSTNGSKKILLRGYQNDGVEALGVIAEKTAEGLARGLKP